MFGKLIVSAAFAASALAQTFSVNTPASLVQCQPASVSWVGGTSPFTLSAIPAGQVSAPAIAFIATGLTASPYTWNVNLQTGLNITLRLADAGGNNVYASPLVIQQGPSNACLNASANTSGLSTVAVSSTSIASGASSSAGSATSAASSAASSAVASASSSAGGIASSASAAVSSAASGAASGASAASSAVASATSRSGALATAVAAVPGLALAALGGAVALL